MTAKNCEEKIKKLKYLLYNMMFEQKFGIFL